MKIKYFFMLVVWVKEAYALEAIILAAGDVMSLSS